MSLKTDNNILINKEDVYKMLDCMLEKRESEWWDKFYEDKEKGVPFFEDKPDENIIEYFDKGILKNGKALDIGCGNGRNSRYIAYKGLEVIGLDYSNESIDWAKSIKSKVMNKPYFICESIYNYTGVNNCFDYINDSGCFHHIKPHRREEYLKKVVSLLKDDGYFSMTCFNLDGGANISDYEVYEGKSMHGGMGFTEFKLRKILEEYFEIIEFRRMKDCTDKNVYGKDFLWAVLMKKKM